ncbi:transporter [Mesonia aquimarina]|uniref:transporter n=1 Tax=Mesonia aquimarina TaxID=1504967 RepID=UPI000EF5FDF8|nr:transporter [Mesonia aquimarina]
MLKHFLPALGLFFFSFTISAQYTETINSNRPGNSSGAFAVGNQVLQFETGLQYGQNNHDLLETETDQLGVDYEVRYGFLMEQLEINLKGTYLSSTQQQIIGGQEIEYKYRNFRSNTLGVKYLIYDPYKNDYFEKPNLKSWKANNSFKWKDLIPAVSVYAGANLLFGDNPYLAPNEPNISPQFVLLTQNNWGRWVFVMNFVVDKVTTDYPSYAGIFTMTHSINSKVSVFGEYQVIKNDLYSDNLLRAGGAYLLTKDLQLDASAMVNFKNTPSRWQATLGVSYRIDMHSSDELIFDPAKKEKPEEDAKKKRNSELVNPDGTMND